MATFKEEKIELSEIPPLLHPPLVEAIFEVRWEIENDEKTNRMRDPSYPMMYGSLYERLKKDFSIIEDLPSTQAHPEATPYVPRHRMRKEKNGYPLIQVGPGIATINHVKGYSWSGFRSLCLRLVDSIIDLFPKSSLPLNFVKIELRYVNGFRFDIARENPLTFLAEKLHTKIEVAPKLFLQNKMVDRPNSFGLSLSYVLDKPLGHLSVGTSLGQIEGKPALIQQTLVQSFGETVPADYDAVSLWMDEAHKAVENSFLALCEGSLMEKFCGA